MWSLKHCLWFVLCEILSDWNKSKHFITLQTRHWSSCLIWATAFLVLKVQPLTSAALEKALRHKFTDDTNAAHRFVFLFLAVSHVTFQTAVGSCGVCSIHWCLVQKFINIFPINRNQYWCIYYNLVLRVFHLGKWTKWWHVWSSVAHFYVLSFKNSISV